MSDRRAAALLVAAAIAGLGLCAPAAPARARADAAAPDSAAGPEVRDPLFELFIDFAVHDSLGAWEADGLRALVARSGRSTRLPLGHLVRVERRAAAADESESRDGAAVSRVWRLVFDDALEFPMPYSLLGYHPGSLRLSREITLSEWRLGDANVRLAGEDSTRIFAFAGVLCWRLDAGKLVLDADGWLDKLLGGALDDTWTDGLACGRLDGRLAGLALGVNRDGHRIMGEFDFRADKVLANGRPPARALAALCRPFTTPAPGRPPRAWRE